MKKKGQVTMFVIVGIVVLFIFLFLIQLNTNLIESSLQRSQESVLSKVFQKEALRIYVEDCLIDELEEGLFLVGKYGRLWDDFGGSAHFVEGVSGTTYLGEQIYYGIQAEEYLEHPNAYPCNSEENYPAFCNYKFPNTEVKFGKLSYELEEEILEDIETYLKEKATVCVQEFVTDELSSGLTLEFNPEEVELDLSLKSDGLSVEATYPITLTAGEDNFFHLATFDFLYPSGFKRMLDAAVVLPLRWDWQFVDFPHQSSTMKLEKFNYFREENIEIGGISLCDAFGDELWLCSRRLSKEDIDELEISLKNKEIAPNGDTIFTFTSPFPNVINRPENYTFRIARKNRAPALDLITRCPGTDYEYLVMEGDDFPDEFGEVIIKPNSTDPDDDVFEWSERIPIIYTSALGGELETEAGDEIIYSPPYESNDFMITVAAIDEFEARDWQDIRVKVAERELPEIEFLNAIDFSKPLSLEDPICVNFHLSDAVDEFQFTIEGEELRFEEGENGLVNDAGLPMPNNCELDNFAQPANIKDLLSFLRPGTSVYHIDGNAIYENDNPECTYSIEMDVDLQVAECTYHVNEEYPFPAPDGHKIKVDPTTGLRTIEPINPYLATHACCTETGTYASADTICYWGETCESPPGTPKPYYLKNSVVRCGNAAGEVERGNYCGGLAEIVDDPTSTICGVSSLETCPDDIPIQCQRQKPWSVIEYEGWCGGTEGCGEGTTGWCTSEIVIMSYPNNPGFNPVEHHGLFTCGCDSDGITANAACDSDFDGDYGSCNAAGECIGG